MCVLARTLGVKRAYLYRLVYGLILWPAHQVRKLIEEAERRRDGLNELIEGLRHVETEALERKAKTRAGHRIRFKERWGFWPETRADKEARWAKMRGPPAGD